MTRSTFSQTGLDIGKNDINMTYLYGIADFFAVMFEDTSRVNLLLEANSQVAAEAYSKFVQMTSTISLEEVQNTLGQSLKLVTINSTDKVDGQLNTFVLDSTILASRLIANRPLLPTALLENDVDYRIETKSDGSVWIRFAKSIDEAGFSTRLLSDETTKQYALWFVDTAIDEQWITNNYATLIGVDPATSTDAFKNLVYGLYYIYVQGPTLEMLRKGLNLCLGVPLARDPEQVLEIRQYPETAQWIVVTDSNQYLLPYGLTATVNVGDTLKVGDEIAQWVEVKDYINDGDWWIDLMIPTSIIPTTPAGQINRYASAGSHFDYLMRNYLKKHTFLVNVKVQDFKNNQTFSQISDIIKRAKPVYTQAIYIWTIPQLEEGVTLSEDLFVQRRDQSRCDNVTLPIEQLHRNNTDVPLKRGCPMFTRFSVPFWISKLNGTNTYTNGSPFDYQGGTAYGFINPSQQYRPNTPGEQAWIRTLQDRGAEIQGRTRRKIGHTRGSLSANDGDRGFSGKPVHVLNSWAGVTNGARIIPLYITTQTDIINKCNASSLYPPDMTQWVFSLMNPNDVSEAINALAINDGPANTTGQLIANYSVWAQRGSDVNYLSNVMPDIAFQQVYTPALGDIQTTDYILGVRVYDAVVGVYWVTTNNLVEPAPYMVIEENDQLVTTFTAPPKRGLGPTSSSWYLTRSRGSLNYSNDAAVINDSAINEGNPSGNTVQSTFSDSLNTSVPRTRGGTPFIHRMELK